MSGRDKTERAASKLRNQVTCAHPRLGTDDKGRPPFGQPGASDNPGVASSCFAAADVLAVILVGPQARGTQAVATALHAQRLRSQDRNLRKNRFKGGQRRKGDPYPLASR